MGKFKLGDKVLVRGMDSSSSSKLDGKIGTIIGFGDGWYNLDIEKGGGSGLWERELELVKKPIKVSKKEMETKKRKIIKEIKANKLYANQFKDIEKEVNGWSPEQIIGWFK